MKTYEERMEAVQQKLQRKRVQRRALSVTAGALCLCIVAGLFFIPDGNGGMGIPQQDTTDITKYEGSEYYNVIKALQQYQKDAQFGEEVKDDMMELPEAGMPQEPGAAPDKNENTNQNNASVNVTDNQVQGVEEGDLIKRSKTHIFYLKHNKLEIYPIAGEETKKIGGCQLKNELPENEYNYYRNAEMYLSADATRLTIVGRGWASFLKEKRGDAYIRITSLDVSDPANVKELESLYVTGYLVSSRMVGDKMLLMTEYTADIQIDFDDKTTYLPHIGPAGQLESVPGDSIVVPDADPTRDYSTVIMLDCQDLKVVDSVSMMSYSTQMYVSGEHIYGSKSYTKYTDLSETQGKRVTMTDISCIGYSEEGLELKGTFSVEGQVKDQYSMDEYEGVFRVVTTTRSSDIEKLPGDYSMVTVKPTNVNLTCFRVGTWEQIAQVAQFAPEGETAESVRFDGNYAYVCTAKVIVLTDPVYFFDLTDLNNITVKDTGTIDGYSSSLIQLKGGFLMGIGYGDAWNLKIEIYKETEEGVRSVCTYVRPVAFAVDYKAYYIDRENNLFGIPTSDGYILFFFDGHQLVELVQTKPLDNLETTRGLVIDGFLYVFTHGDVYLKNLAEM